MNGSTVDAYERILIQPTRQFHVFLYVAHFDEANHLQIGFGIESGSGLQRTHVPGPNVHELHTGALAQWLRQEGRPVLVEEQPTGKQHPFTSQMEVDLPKMLERVKLLPLSTGRYMSLVADPDIYATIAGRFADAIERVHIKAWGHPHDWDVQHHELNDGRFIWLAYDSDLDKIRLGMGFHDATNEKQYGTHTYAIGCAGAAEFSAFHFYYIDAPLQFMGVPPRWPHGLSPFLSGKAKQEFAASFLKLADRVWPGQVTG